MFGKRQTFGGNTPGASEAPRPQPSAPSSLPAVSAARTDVPKPVVDAAINRLRNDDIVDVRSAEAIQRDKDYFQTMMNSSPTIGPLIVKMEADSSSLLLLTADELEKMMLEFKSM